MDGPTKRGVESRSTQLKRYRGMIYSTNAGDCQKNAGRIVKSCKTGAEDIWC